MGNQRERKRKKYTRKSLANHMNDVIKRRRLKSVNDSSISNKENIAIAPVNVPVVVTIQNDTCTTTSEKFNDSKRMQVPENIDMDSLTNSREPDLKILHNMTLVPMPLENNTSYNINVNTDTAKAVTSSNEVPMPLENNTSYNTNVNTDTAKAVTSSNEAPMSLENNISYNINGNTATAKPVTSSNDFIHCNSTPNDDQNQCDDDTDWYEVIYDDPKVEKIFPVIGRRIIDFKYFFESLQNISDHNKAFGCTLRNLYVSSEKRKGLLSKFKLTCNMCNRVFYLDSEEKTKLDLNHSATSGIISSGIGFTQFNEICASIDCPSFTQKHFDKVQSKIYDDWRTTALSVMEVAAKRERDAAIADGHITKDGIPYIDVIVDGAWCKRSFNTNFSALSGAATIVGKRFGEVLYIGVKNKYCCICARAENKHVSPGDHVCYKNYSGSSTSMESEILLEGFKQSIPMHNLIYKRMVADGDSSTYKKISEGRPYPNCSVEKIECRNHIFRNMCKKLKSITTETKYPAKLRKKITTQRILAIRKAICLSITHHLSTDSDFNTKVNNLFRDITNSYNHAFGNHENCQAYYCTSQKNSEDLTITLKTCSIWHRIKFIVNAVASKARSLMHNSDSNKVESFNSVVAKIVGGKRINFTLRRGYESRCNAAVVSFNTKRPLSTLHRTIAGKSPRALVKRFETNLLKQRKIGSKYKRKGRKLFSQKDSDKDYGEKCQKPDMCSTEYERCKKEFLENLVCTDDEIKRIEQSTVRQRDSSEWLELRRKLLTSSNFSKVVNRRKSTSVKNLVKNLIYKKDLSHVPSIKHGIENEAIALEQLSTQMNITIKPCGLFIDKDLPYLGATPDGLVGADTLVEMKCPLTAFRTSIEDAINKKKVTFWKKTKNGFQINKKHAWFMQVQGQLHISGRQKCIFAVWSGQDKYIKTEIIQRDDQFWLHIMEKKLKDFYVQCMLPELCDPRHLRNMPIRELEE